MTQLSSGFCQLTPFFGASTKKYFYLNLTTLLLFFSTDFGLACSLQLFHIVGIIVGTTLITNTNELLKLLLAINLPGEWRCNGSASPVLNVG